MARRSGGVENVTRRRRIRSSGIKSVLLKSATVPMTSEEFGKSSRISIQLIACQRASARFRIWVVYLRPANAWVYAARGPKSRATTGRTSVTLGTRWQAHLARAKSVQVRGEPHGKRADKTNHVSSG